MINAIVEMANHLLWWGNWPLITVGGITITNCESLILQEITTVLVQSYTCNCYSSHQIQFYQTQYAEYMHSYPSHVNSANVVVVNHLVEASDCYSSVLNPVRADTSSASYTTTAFL